MGAFAFFVWVVFLCLLRCGTRDFHHTGYMAPCTIDCGVSVAACIDRFFPHMSNLDVPLRGVPALERFVPHIELKETFPKNQWKSNMNKLGVGFGLREKSALALLIVLVISLVNTSPLATAQQLPVAQESSPQPKLTNSSTAEHSSSASPTSPMSISAKAVLGFGGNFEATYLCSSRNLTVNGAVFWAGNIEILITYSIDGSENHTLPSKLTCPYPDHIIPLAYINGSVVLPLLSVGDHRIMIYGNWTATISSMQNEIELAQTALNFTVRAPVITVFSPENASYLSKDLLVNFTVDEPISWVGYSLDNQGNVTFTENSTLTDLTYGNHTIEVYAKDTAGVMGVSQTVNFAIKAPSEPFSLLIFVAVTSILAAVIVTVGIAVYKRHSNELSVG
jgi:hypothetical protein